jgi:small-conductance mechanosensitive channel
MSTESLAKFFEDIFDFFVDDVLLLFMALFFFFALAWIVPMVWTMISRGLWVNRHITRSTALAICIIIVFVGIGLSFAAIGLDVTQLVTSLGILSIILGLGLQQPLALLFAGIVIRFTNIVEEEDEISVASQGINGTIKNVGAQFTAFCIPSRPNAEYILPNTLFCSTPFVRIRNDRGHPRGFIPGHIPLPDSGSSSSSSSKTLTSEPRLHKIIIE